MYIFNLNRRKAIVIFSFLTCFTFSAVHSQEFSTASVKINSLNAFRFAMNAGDTNQVVYASGAPDGYLKNTLERIDNKGSLVKKILIASPDFDRPFPAYDFKAIDTSLIAFTVLAGKKGELFLYACGLDSKTLEQLAPAKRVFAYKNSSLQWFSGVMPQMRFSEDRKSLLLASLEEEDSKALLKLVLLKGDLSIEWEKKCTSTVEIIGLPSLHFSHGAVILTAFSGTLYPTENGQQIKKLSKSSFHVFTIEEQSKVFLDHVISLDSVHAMSVRAEFLPNGNLICAGLYGVDDDQSEDAIARGIFMVSYPPMSDTPMLKKVTHFPEVFIAGATDEGGLLKKFPTRGLSNLLLNDLILGSDGSAALFTEHIFLGKETMTNNVHFEEINVISFSTTTGVLNWCKRIYKKQISDEFYPRSFSCFESKGRFILFYIEHSESGVYDSDPIPYEGKKEGILTGVSITTKGEIRKNLVTSFNKENPNIPLPVLMHQSGKNTFECSTVNMQQWNSLALLIEFN